ncbi:MAG TPA: SRPBCC family protein [Chitinophagales bacterium]|nr:SRPBCC family protein [Chitinophagales bacterium]
MKYTTEIKINAPIEKVAELIGDHNMMKNWMKELITHETVSGTPRKEGAKTKLRLNLGGGVDVLETLIKIDFPNFFVTKYELPQGSLTVVITFEKDGKGTIYKLDHSFEFKGMLKIGTALMKPGFIKHSERMMQDFKKMVEKES